MVSFIERCASIGYGKSRKDIMCIAQSAAESKGLPRKNMITNGWWRRFIERHNKLSLRKGDSTAYIRMDAVNEETLAEYFDLLEDTLKQNDLQNSPSQIYNVDETGIPLDPKAPKILVPKGIKKPRYQSPGRKGQITVVACGNAAGNVLPPLIIFDTKKVQPAWTKDEVPGSMYGTSDKGWITTELFESWFKDLFLPNAVSARPLLLLLDGHCTHYQPDLIKLAVQNDVLILCLPPHTTHATQPLDCGVFSPLKSHWSTVCHKFIQKNPGKLITRYNFNGLFSKAWLKSVVPTNLIAGFKVCGVYPLNRQAVKPNEAQSAECQHNESIESYEQIECTECPDDVNDEITPELEKKFQLRFEEGYDLCIDPLFTDWLKKNHPESVIHSESVSIADAFSYITPLSPLPAEIFESVDNTMENNYEEDVDDTTQREVTDSTSNTISKETGSDASEDMEVDESRDIGITSTEISSSIISSEVTCGNNNVSVLSKLLVDYTPQVTPVSRSKPRAKLLTSGECLKMLQEKEDKKKRQLEEREQKRKEREEKKKIREEEAEKKKQEKERKAQERAEKAKQKSKGSAGHSKNPRKRNDSETPRTSSKRKKSSEAVDVDAVAEANNPSLSKEINNTTESTGSTLGTVNDSIDVNVCCMCFETYENDVLEGNRAEWIDCACGRWLHLDCAEDHVVDSNGKELYCPYCLC